jgi:AcrR family transcriptional regulator
VIGGFVVEPDETLVARRAHRQRGDRDQSSRERGGGGDAQSEIHAADECRAGDGGEQRPGDATGVLGNVQSGSEMRTEAAGSRAGKRLPRAEREQQLLDVAERLFIAQGYERTSIEDVAHAAGVSRPIVYDHHGSKEGLYLACVKRARARYAEQLEQVLATISDPREKIKAGAERFFTILEQDPERWIVLFGGSAVPLFGELGEQLHQLRAISIASVAAVIRGQAPDADPEEIDAFAHAISGVGEQLGRWWLQHPTIPRERVVEDYTDFILSGLRHLA